MKGGSTPAPSSRAAALDVLLSWDRRRRPVTPILSRARERLSDPRERSLLTNIVMTTLRWLGWADAVLESRLAKGLDSLSPVMRWDLRMGVVQLLKIPGQESYAVVDTCVNLAKERGFGGQAGLVNGVLRGILRRPPEDSDMDAGDPVLDLARRHSHPPWLVSRWLGFYGPEAVESILRWNNSPPPLSLRLRGDERVREGICRQMRESGLDATQGAILPEVIRLRAGLVTEESPLLAEGRAVVQDESEALVSLLWDPEPPVLDACAGPGTKSGHLADRLEPDGLVVGLDLVRERAAKVRETARRLRLGNLCAVQGDALRPPLGGKLRAILVDAPCTNLGVLCRRPDARWIRRPGEIGRRAALQKDLLAASIDLLAPGGYVLYSVCTLEPEETRDVIGPFLEKGVLRIAELPGSLPGALVDSLGCIRIIPGTLGMEGVFAALLRRA